MKLLFIHRSVGQQIIDCVRENKNMNNIEIYDLNANDNTLTNAVGSTTKDHPLTVPDGDTSPEGLARFFERALEDKKNTNAPLSKFDIITFKSCYSANNIRSQRQLESYKDAYSGTIAAYIQANPEKKFVIISPPPRKSLLTTTRSSHLAKEFSVWLAKFSENNQNCAYFNLFDTLSDNNILAKKFCRRAPWNQHPNQSGAQKAADCLTLIINEQ